MSNTIGNFIHKVKDQVFGGHEKTEENGSGINIKDTFDKTDGEGPSIGKLTTAAGVGTVLGISLANKRELSEHDKRIGKNEDKIKDLEKRMEEIDGKKSVVPSKDMGRQLSSLVNGDKPAAPAAKEAPTESKDESVNLPPQSSSFTVGYAKECLKKSDEYSNETNASLFKHALEEIEESRESTPTEKAIAECALERMGDFKYIVVTFEGRPYQYNSTHIEKLQSFSGKETLSFLSEPKNMEGSSGKVMMNFHKKMMEAITPHHYNKGSEQDTHNSFTSLISSIPKLPLSTPYEKDISNWMSKNKNYIKDCPDIILDATEKSNPIKDIAKFALKYYDGEIKAWQNAFDAITESSVATDGEKALAKEGMAIGEEFHMSNEDKIKDATKILKQLAGSEE